MSTKAKTGKEPSPKYEQRRQEVFRAAARTFSRLGYHVATLDDVAEELGVTKPALYYYAKNKDDLLFQCGQLALENLASALDGSDAAGLTGRERLVRFFRQYTAMICEDFGRCLVLTEPKDLTRISRDKNVAGRRDMNHAVRAMIRDGIADGSLKACDDRLLSIALFDAFNGVVRWFDPAGPTSLETITEHYLEIFLGGIAAE